MAMEKLQGIIQSADTATDILLFHPCQSLPHNNCSCPKPVWYKPPREVWAAGCPFMKSQTLVCHFFVKLRNYREH